MNILSRLKIKNFVLEKNFFSRYPIWKSLCLPVKNPNFPKIFFASSRAPQKLQKKSVWRNPSINFDLVYLILYPRSLSVDACLLWRKLRSQSTQSYIMNRTTEKSEISNYFTDWLVQWSSSLIFCRKVGSVYCLRGSKTNLFGLPFVWDSVRQFNCVSDRYSYQSFSRDEIDLKWSSQE